MKKNICYSKSAVDFDLRQLEIFCKVVELRSFSKAADAVFLAQASVSERIAVLERMTGTKLLDRLGRQIALTSAGKILYRHAVFLLESKRTACLEMEAFLGTKKGNVNIGASTIPGEYILPKILGRFNRSYPLISVELTIADTSEIEHKVINGDFELGIVGSKDSNRNLVYQELWDDELVLAIPAEHCWANKNEISINKLFGEPFILRENGSGTLEVINNFFMSASKDIKSLNVVACFGSSTAVKEGIKSGLGVSIISSRAIDMELKAGVLKALKIKNLLMLRKFFLIKDRRRTVSPLCSIIADFFIT